jgi:hypothetical protein
MLAKAAALPGRANLALADLVSVGERPRDAVEYEGKRIGTPGESFLAPAGVEIPEDVRLFVSPREMVPAEGAQYGRTVLVGGRPYPGTVAHELTHVTQDRRWGPFSQAAYALIAEILKRRGQNPYTAHPFENEAEASRFEYERKKGVSEAVQRHRAGERKP